jgi:type I restriction enzyme S subunit
MKWETYKLKQLCSEIVDCVNKTAPTSDVPTPYKMLRTSDIREGKINLENLNCVTKEVYEKWTRRGKLQKGDVIFTREAPLGEVGLVREEKNYFLGQRLVLFRANNKMCDGRFLMYSLLWHDNKQAIISKGVGSTVAHLRVPECENIEIKVPDLDVQHRIADILSAYDDLIENNQKQIKLLEEAARRLYKEWFVDLRFPGHENTKIVDGVPEGWSRGLLKELISVNYGKDHKKAPDDGNIPVYGSGGLMRKCNKSLFSGEAVLIPRKGSLNNIMYVDETFWTVDTMFYATMKQPHTAVFVYFFVKAFDMYSMNIGAAVPSMTTKILDAMDVVIPDKETLEKFDKLTKTYFNKIKTLQGQNERLKIARDLLLPKLMSGEVEV